MDAFELTGTVEAGKRLGTTLGFPTANVRYDPHGRAWPKEGVYVATAQLNGDGRVYVAILNQGHHPTAPGGAPTVEAHLLGFGGGALYGRRITLRYQQYLRPETKFPTLAALQKQLERDRLAALEWARTQTGDFLNQRSLS